MMLKFGSVGADVRELQTALNFCVEAALVPDGNFGAKTHAALQRFQRTANLQTDGVFGPLTGSALASAAILRAMV